MARQFRPGQLQTGSLFNISSSYAITASFALNGGGGGTNIDTSSFATTGSNIFKGNQTISGSIYLNSGSVIDSIGADIVIKAGSGSNAGVVLYNTNASQYLAVDGFGSYANKFTVVDTLTVTGVNGKLIYTGTTPGANPTLAEIHAYNDNPWLEKFYNDTFSTSSAAMAYFGWNDGRFVFHNESTQSIGLQVNGYNAENGLLVYSNKVAFVNNVEISGSLSNGYYNIASGSYSHAEGSITQAIGDYSHAEGDNTRAKGNYSHAEGQETIASGSFSHAEGYASIAIGQSSHAEGSSTIASGDYSHAEGTSTVASAPYSHAEGGSTVASGDYSHAEGTQAIASGSYSHAEGDSTQAIGISSHAEGESTKTFGNASHAEGLGTIAKGDYQHVQGQYNISSSIQSAFIVGNGTDNNNRSNLIFAAGNEVQITGSIIALSFTGSLFGTASWATNAVTASFIDGGFY